jgi:hypothetical protein
VRLPVMAFGILGVAVVAGQPTSATAQQSYPWCAQGDNILHCYYMTRELCEAAVDYHGFCVANSNGSTLNNEAPQPLTETNPRSALSTKMISERRRRFPLP